MPSTDGSAWFHSEMISSSLMATSFLLVLRYLSCGEVNSSDTVTTNGIVNVEDGGVMEVDCEDLGAVHVSDGRHGMLGCLFTVK